MVLTPEIKQQLEIESDGRIRVAADRESCLSVLSLVLRRLKQDYGQAMLFKVSITSLLPKQMKFSG